MATQVQLPALALNLPVLAAGGSDLAKWGLDPSAVLPCALRLAE
jgi:hypothetical protein